MGPAAHQEPGPGLVAFVVEHRGVDPEEGLVMVLLTQTLPAGGLDATSKFYTLVYQALVR